ncbi:hypothetical protein EV382_3527 [Micromonospora violae]|uniref:Uncharacterized protein n=1 Tax=Micromonospora violae TaxID=1278207 RepID=A0A4Q7UIX2_9ACTN|nr:hypothetical protein EV382_3527 [Micromonospora violae]
MGGAGVRDHGPPRGLQRQVRHAEDQTPALGQHPAPGSLDELAEVGRHVNEPRHLQTYRPVDLPDPIAEPVSEVRGGFPRQVGTRSSGLVLAAGAG